MPHTTFNRGISVKVSPLDVNVVHMLELILLLKSIYVVLEKMSVLALNLLSYCLPAAQLVKQNKNHTTLQRWHLNTIFLGIIFVLLTSVSGDDVWHM